MLPMSAGQGYRTSCRGCSEVLMSLDFLGFVGLFVVTAWQLAAGPLLTAEDGTVIFACSFGAWIITYWAKSPLSSALLKRLLSRLGVSCLWSWGCQRHWWVGEGLQGGAGKVAAAPTSSCTSRGT